MLKQLRQNRDRKNVIGLLLGANEDDGSWERSVPHFYYPEGPISDLVYPVNGGLEDWAYSAAFQPAPNPISNCVGSSRGRRWMEESAAPAKQHPATRMLAGPAAFWQYFGGWGGAPSALPPALPREETVYDRSGVRCAMYLIETHDDKSPPASEYGASAPSPRS